MGQFYDHPRYKVEVKDTAGAAFLAGVICSLMNQKSPKKLLAFANAMGAYVSANDRATPIVSLQKIVEKFDLEKDISTIWERLMRISIYSIT